MKIILFYGSPSYPQLQRLLLLLKIQKNPTLQQVSGGNTPNIVLKRILRYFLKTPPLKKILQFQEKKLLSLLKTPKQPLQQVFGWETSNLVLKRMLKLFLKFPPLKKISEFQDQKKDCKICAKRKFRT